MASLADSYTYSQNAGFQHQVQAAMVTAAIAIAGEAAAFDRDKRALAFAVLSPNGLNNYTTAFSLAVAIDATFGATIAAGGASATGTDAQLQSAVNAAWAAIASRIS